MDERIKKLYEGPRIEEVDGNFVSSDAVGETDFSRGKIRVAKFNKIFPKLSPWIEEKYRTVAKALQKYVLDHELWVEWVNRPKNEEEHAYLTAEHVREEYENGNIVPLVYHMIGIEHGGRSKQFSKMIEKYFPLRKTYQEVLRKYKDFVEDIRETMEKLLELKPLEAYECGKYV